MKELLLRTATGILLVVLFLGSIMLGPFSLVLILLVVYALGTKELYVLKSMPFNVPALLAALSGALLILVIYAFLYLDLKPVWLFLPPGLWTFGFALSPKRYPASLVFFWLALPLALFLAIGWFPDGSWKSILPIATITLVWVNDTFAYVSGSLFGKHPMTPRLSPGKTWEGFVGGMMFSMLSAWIFYYFSGHLTPFIWIGAGAITSLFSMAGDLFESGLKRKNNVKDTGRILPGHGGILDRFDSLLFVAPALFLLFLLIHLFS